MCEKNKRGRKLDFLRARLTKKIIIVIVIILVLCCGAIGLKKVVFSESKTTKLGFENIGELATQTAYCTEVNVTKAAREMFGVEIPFTQSKYIYSYDIVIKAGFDFKEIDWSESNSVIRIKLPEAKILSSEIDMDSFKVYHEDESLFRQISLTENNEALKTMKKTAEENAIANGLLKNARENVETILTSFFAKEYDMKKYKIEFVDK